MPEIPEKLRAAPKAWGWATRANREALGLRHCLLTAVIQHCLGCCKITFHPEIRVSANATNPSAAIYAFDWWWCPPSVFLLPTALLLSSLPPKTSQNFSLLIKCSTFSMISHTTAEKSIWMVVRLKWMSLEALNMGNFQEYFVFIIGVWK